MKKLFTLLVAAFVAGCASQGSSVLPYSDGVFIASAGSTISFQRSMNKALRDAHEFCSKQGRETKIIDTKSVESSVLEVSVYFKCI